MSSIQRGKKATPAAMAPHKNTSISLALSFATSVTAAPNPPSRTSSKMQAKSRSENTPRRANSKSGADRPREFSLYKGISDRPLGWKNRRKVKPEIGQAARDAKIKRWDGAARTKTDWDGLRRDPELWYPDGDCLVHLHAQGQSRRGPAFQVPFEALINSRCRPLLNQYLVQDFDRTPNSEPSSSDDADYFDQPSKSGTYELFIPAPPVTERGQAMLHHVATRNFFAWIFGKPMVGPHLGGALVALLNSMNVFRSDDADNVQDILDYMEEQEYADMRDEPNHALAVLFFAEQFQFRDLWLDAYVHCAGMNEKLSDSSEFDHITRKSRTIIRRGRLEMDVRLDRCGRSLSTFLEDELSSAHLGLSTGARAHLEFFRSFLQAYYVEKLGYFPPLTGDDGGSAFPRDIYESMAKDFEHLYAFLVDDTFNLGTSSPPPAQGGICVLQNLQAFDQRHLHRPLPHPLPLLPASVREDSRSLTGRLSWVGKPDKLKHDKRATNMSALANATNRRNWEVIKSPLVRAYSAFEKEHVFSSAKAARAGKSNKISVVDSRKVRWIMIYAVLQTLRSATDIPDEVRDAQEVPYNICVRTADCPPWQDETPANTFTRKARDQFELEWDEFSTTESTSALSTPYFDSPETITDIKPDIDYFQLKRQSSTVSNQNHTSPLTTSRKGTVRRALSTLGNMPELRHPRPVRASFHEILVQGYGNGLNTVSLSSPSCPSLEFPEKDGNASPDSIDSGSFSEKDLSPDWSHNESDDSSPSSISDSGSENPETHRSKSAILDMLDSDSGVLVRRSSSIYDDESGVSLHHLQPEPLDLSGKNGFQTTKPAMVEYEMIEGISFAGYMCT